MEESCIADRLGRHVRLSDGERTALAQLERDERCYRRGDVVVRENVASRELFIVRSGWLHSSVLLGNGSRQIMAFHFKGDLAGLPMLAFRSTPETLTAVTDVSLCPLSREKLGATIADHPRLGLLLLSFAAASKVTLADRLASIGRTSASSRVAMLICEVHRRMLEAGESEGAGFLLPLTQEEIGDATGLTAVHVNRMLRSLADDKVIEREGGKLRVLDAARLADQAQLTRRPSIDTSWLPALD